MKKHIEPAPEFLQGLDLEQLKSIYTGWQVVFFSSEQVILRCSIEGMSDEVYVLGEDDGFLAGFYEDGKKQLRLKERPDSFRRGCASSGRKIWRRCLRILCHKEFLIRRFYC